MANALWITLIGMGLVFAAIVLLWGLMALLVRLTTQKAAVKEAPAAETSEPAQIMPGSDLKRRAAVAAVALALALQQKPALTMKKAASSMGVSAWQAANRAGQLAAQSTGRERPTRKQRLR